MGSEMCIRDSKVYETAYGYNQPGRAVLVSLSWAPKR